MHSVARDLAASAGPRTRVLWMSNERGYMDRDLFDAFHLQWPAVQRLSATIAKEMTARETATTRLSRLGSKTGCGAAGM